MQGVARAARVLVLAALLMAMMAAVHLVVPIAPTAVVLLFLIVQAQFDKRDPKLTGAPIHREDDGMSFE